VLAQEVGVPQGHVTFLHAARCVSDNRVHLGVLDVGAQPTIAVDDAAVLVARDRRVDERTSE
jgi:hypothetical protein